MSPMRAARVAALLLFLALGAAAEPEHGPAFVDGARIRAADAEPESWLAHGRTYDEQRHSPLTQITRENLGRLGVAWSYATGTTRGLEATPIVVDGVMYATGNWGVVFALDAATGRQLWRFDPQVAGAKARDACCDIVNRGVAVWKGRVYVGALDGRLIALDAASGEPIWQVATFDPKLAYTITGAPRVVKGRVIIGNGGAELGVRGFFSAYDADTGALLWRFYTVPASKQGPHEHPELELAAKTWSKDSLWESGLGGTVWDSMAYDPELDLLYVGVGNASVYDRTKRSPGGGDNLFVSSILAIRPETGRMVWHYQTTPGDFWDFTATQHMILGEIEIAGKPRKVLMQAPKNGFFYVLDRETGEFLSAEAYVDVSWASHVDPKTGRPVEREEAHWDSKPAFVTPAPPGGHNWQPMTYSPRTGLVYIPTSSLLHRYVPNPRFVFRPGAWNTGEDFAALMAEFENYEKVPFCNPSHITAWDPVEQRQAWRVNKSRPMPGGLLSTASDLLFQGQVDGRLVAYDARDGTPLWEGATGTGVMAPPITYAIDGEQYVAVLAGLGGSHGGHFETIDDANHGRLVAFKLGGSAPSPPRVPRPVRRRDPPKLELSKERVEQGRALYAENCFSCHGVGTHGSGLHPDLKYASRETHAQWNEIVLGGTRQARGMASFADQLSPDDARAIQVYVIERTLHEPGLGETLAAWASQYACVPVSWMAD
jgi:quinohemoprotein ethanol dehydrogenase